MAPKAPAINLKNKPSKAKPPQNASNPVEAFLNGQMPSIDSNNSVEASNVKTENQVIEDKESSKVTEKKPKNENKKNSKLAEEKPKELEKPKRGRPPKTTETKKQYSISIKPSLYDRAKKTAEKQEKSVNEIISEALIKYLK